MTAAARAIARVEFLRLFRDRTALVFMLVLPVAIMMVVGSSSFDTEKGIPIGLFVVSDSPVLPVLAAADNFDLRTMESRNDLLVAVRLDDVAGGVLVDGRDVTLLVDVATSDAVSTRALLLGVLAEESAILGVADQFDLAVDDVREAAGTVRRGGVERTVVGQADAAIAASDFSYTAPSNLVLFTFLNSLAVGAGLTASKELGVFTRWNAAPIRRRDMVGGVVASRFAFASVQAGLIVVVGAVLFGVDWGDPIAVVALTGVFALIGTAVSVLAGVLARTPQQTSSIGIPVGIGLGMLGGCMWPLDIVPDVMRTIGHLAPHVWAMDGFRTLVFDDGTILDITTELGVLAAFAVVLLVLSVQATGRSLR